MNCTDACSHVRQHFEIPSRAVFCRLRHWADWGTCCPDRTQPLGIVLPDRRRQSNVAAAGILAGLVLDKDVIQRLLRRELMRESVIYQELWEEVREGVNQEIRQEIRREVRREIHEEVREEIKQSKVNLILRILARRFKQAIPSTAETQVCSLEIEQLDLLGEALVDFVSLADLEAWLASQAKEFGFAQELQAEVRKEVKQSEANLILRQLARRLQQAVPSTTETQVRSLNLNLLETLGEALLDFTSLADLEEWLRLRVRGLGQ